MSIKTHEGKKRMRQLMSTLGRVEEGAFVTAGIHSDAGNNPISGVSVAYTAFTAEHGGVTESGNIIPPRPFFKRGIQVAVGMARKLLPKAFQSAPKGYFKEIALEAEEGLKGELLNGNHLPLSPVTLKFRERRDNISQQPLFDTGTLYRKLKGRVPK